VAAEREARTRTWTSWPFPAECWALSCSIPRTSCSISWARTMWTLCSFARTHRSSRDARPDRRVRAALRSLPRVCLGVEIPGLSSLLIDNEVGMYTAVKHLITAHDRRKIAMIAGPVANPEAQARYRGFARALAEQGMPVDARRMGFGNFTRPAVPGGGRAT